MDPTGPFSSAFSHTAERMGTSGHHHHQHHGAAAGELELLRGITTDYTHKFAMISRTASKGEEHGDGQDAVGFLTQHSPFASAGTIAHGLSHPHFALNPAPLSDHHSSLSQLSDEADMSSKQQRSISSRSDLNLLEMHEQPLLNYPLYANHELKFPAQNRAYSSPDDLRHVKEQHPELEKLARATALELSSLEEQASMLRSTVVSERLKQWSLMDNHGGVQERGRSSSYNMSPLLEVAEAAAATRGVGRANTSTDTAAAAPYSAIVRQRTSSDVGARTSINIMGSSVNAGQSLNESFLDPNTAIYNHNVGTGSERSGPEYSTLDLEILRANQLHNDGSCSSVQSQQLYATVPSNVINYHLPFDHHSYSLNQRAAAAHHGGAAHEEQFQYHDHQHLPKLHPSDQHHPPSSWHSQQHELLLLPRADQVTTDPASIADPLGYSAGLSNTQQLDLLHGSSSLHDKQTAAPFELGGRGSGIAHHHHARSGAPFFVNDHVLDMNVKQVQAQPAISQFLHSPQQYGASQSLLSLDAARYYSSRSASGSLGVLRNSKYLKAAQQLLNEFCNVHKDGIPDDVKRSMQAGSASMSLHVWNGGSSHVSAHPSKAFRTTNCSSADIKGANLQHPAEFYNNISDQEQQQLAPQAPNAADQSPAASCDQTHQLPSKQLPADERCHYQMKKARLIAMVEELDRRYQQYKEQLQLIITSFESATGMGAAAPYTVLARKAMSRQFRSLRDAMGEQIRSVCTLLGEEVSSVPILSKGETPRLRLVDQRLRHQRSLQQIGMLPQQQAWRPQRGLPERSVSVLRAWLFEHFLHPYPKDSEKSMLSRLTGLSRNQVSNWFINARVRLWKPMIEEMYVEESKALEMEDAAEAAAAAAAHNNNTSSRNQVSRSSNIVGAPEPSESRQLAWSSELSGAPQGAAVYNNNIAGVQQQHQQQQQQHRFLFENARQQQSLNGLFQISAAGNARHIRSVVAGQCYADYDNNITALSLQQQQAAALLLRQQCGSTVAPQASTVKNGVSLTLELQQPPPASSAAYSATTNYTGRHSEALLF